MSAAKTAILTALIALAVGWAGPATANGCLDCHQGFASPMPPSPAQGNIPDCLFCHGGDATAKALPQAHQGLRANPSALDAADQTCGRCHPGWPEKVRRSPMATNAGLINQTRYLWGAQPSPAPLWATRKVGPLEQLPQPDVAGGQAVDDLLRRRCLRCHLWSPGADMDGARRSAGCAACHAPTDDQGRKIHGHRLSKSPPVAQCLRCHASDCGAGAEYVGLTPADEHFTAHFAQIDPARPKLFNGRVWRETRPDLHHQAGLACIDCHVRAEIMGDGQIRQAALLHVGLRCQSCHGRPGQPPRQARTSHGQAMTNVSIKNGAALVRGKLSGKTLVAPSLANGPDAPAAHLAPGHQRLACHACHGAANPAVWGLQVLLDTRPGPARWRDIAAQGDHQLWAMAWADDQAQAPRALDLLSGRPRDGVWVLSPFFRRLEWRVHGQGPDGRTFLLRPRFQYVVTILDENGRPSVAGQIPSPGLGLAPWRPHNTRRPTVGCADCHGNAMALGLGLTFLREDQPNQPPALAPELWLPRAEGLAMDGGWTKLVDLAGRPQQVMLIQGARPFARELLHKLLRPGKQYIKWLLRDLDARAAKAAETQAKKP